MNATVIWDDDPGGNVEHIALNGLVPEEVDSVLLDPAIRALKSHSSGRPCKFGWTNTGKHIFVVWQVESDDPRVIYPVTAYEVDPP